MLRQAVLGAYPNPYDLKIFLSDQMDVQFTEIVRGDEYRHIVFDLIEKFQADGRLEEFITFIAGKPLSVGTELTCVALAFSELIIDSTYGYFLNEERTNRSFVDRHPREETGSLLQSYADIFAVLIANRNKNDISEWNWEIGRPLGEYGNPLRNFANPTLYGQPDHWSQYYDAGKNVCYNCGIHNKAAYNLINANLFDYVTLSNLFYHALCELSMYAAFGGATFARSGVVLMGIAATIFREDADIKSRAETAINKAFADVGITL